MANHDLVSRAHHVWSLLRQTVDAWNEDKVPRHGAALAYYTGLSLLPLLIVIMAIIGLIFGQEAAQGYVIQQMRDLLGPQGGDAIQDMIRRADQPGTGLMATILGTATLLFAASGVFAQLQDSLNTIWGVGPKPGRGIWGILRDRFISFSALLGTGFLLLVSLVLSAGLAALGKWYGRWLPLPELALQAMDLALSLVVLTGLFAMMFKLLPDAKMAWRDVWMGAALTAILFTLGKFAIGLYLGKSDVASPYGAAGSMIVLLVWVYYSAQILLFGAEFTQIHANAAGARVRPKAHAVVTDPNKAQASTGAFDQPRTAVPARPASAAEHAIPTAYPRQLETEVGTDRIARWGSIIILLLSIGRLILTRSSPADTHPPSR